MVDVQDVIIIYAAATVTIVARVFVVVLPHVVVIVLYGLELQLILIPATKVMTAVMHDLQAAAPLDRGFGPLAALDNQHVIQLPKVLVCQVAAQVQAAVAALDIFVDSKWVRQTVVVYVQWLHTLVATGLQMV